MLRRVLLSGILGFVVPLAWTFVANAIFGLRARVELNRLQDERRVYDVLKESVTVPGVYVVNPAQAEEGRFPTGEPVFSVVYTGFSHDAAARTFWIELAIGLGSALLVAALLSLASPTVLARYVFRVLFIACLGLLLGVAGDLTRGYPLASAALLGANTVISWTLAGLVMAALLRPQQAATPV